VIELDGPSAPAGDAEQLVGELQRLALRPSGQRLPRDHRAAVELDDRLIESADRSLRQDLVEERSLLVHNAFDQARCTAHLPYIIGSRNASLKLRSEDGVARWVGAAGVSHEKKCVG